MSDNWVFQPVLIGNAKHGDVSKTRFDRPCQRTATVQNARVDLWDGPTGTYVPPAAPIQMQLVSASANDAAAGTGVQTVLIHYLDHNYNPQTTLVTLNGVTPVVTVPADILRVNDMHAVTVGSGGAPAGVISLQAVGGAITYAIMGVGYNRARMPMFTVPAGKTGYVIQWQGSSGSPAATHFVNIDLLATTHDGVLLPGVFLYHDGMAGQNTASEVHLDIPLVLPEKTDIKMSAISDSGTANATAVGNFIGWYE
ncbi:MAG: hypothetical protein ACYC36_02425 [Bellilinea sp.]